MYDGGKLGDIKQIWRYIDKQTKSHSFFSGGQDMEWEGKRKWRKECGGDRGEHEEEEEGWGGDYFNSSDCS